tara:strand:+ start:439 stop:618 length:180 start_codon:yes stop_codon:yes gene_type:complete
MKKITFTKQELKLLDYVILEGYADGDIFQEGNLDKKSDQRAFIKAWEKIAAAILKENEK